MASEDSQSLGSGTSASDTKPTHFNLILDESETGCDSQTIRMTSEPGIGAASREDWVKKVMSKGALGASGGSLRSHFWAAGGNPSDLIAAAQQKLGEHWDQHIKSNDDE